MDSFYDAPRRPPAPRNIPISTEKILPSLVPDVSMLVQNHGNIPQKKAEISYNAWKMQNKFGKENIQKGPSQPSICRKQVRFESPALPELPKKQMEEAPIRMFGNIRNQVDDSFNLSNFQTPVFKPPELVKTVSNVRNCNTPKNPNNILQVKPFEKFYMANIPNRNLDLSIIEPPRMPIKPLSLQNTRTFNVETQPTFKESTTYKESQMYKDSQFYKESFPQKEPTRDLEQLNRYQQKEDTLDTQLNHFQPSNFNSYLPFSRTNKAESTTIEQPKPKNDDEPTVKDLLKIIQQQNEQLMTLQKQVTTLIEERSETQNYTNKTPITVFKNRPLEPKTGLPKFAIDVMTSFEVSIRPPFNNRKVNRDFIQEAKIQEIFDKEEPEKVKKPTDVSLTLNEPLVVQEECRSPDNSIHVDMQDFSSDSEDDTSSQSSLIGWTIYNNVMGQVNYLLKKSQEPDQVKPSMSSEKLGGNTMKKVKEATLKHLKNVGVKLPNVEEVDTMSSDSSTEYSPTEISFAVKQLLMKYLPDEQLARINNAKVKPDIKANYPTNLINRRPEFSMATVQYMEKYNLLNNGGRKSKHAKNEDKMLDITALKQQPKLL